MLMNRLAILVFQLFCVLLYLGLAVYLATTHGWVILLIFVVQFFLLMAVQTQVTSQRNAIAELQSQVDRLTSQLSRAES
jgi:1,4-dihydroxy-2-naphthoate octaprenyltransferase